MITLELQRQILKAVREDSVDTLTELTNELRLTAFFYDTDSHWLSLAIEKRASVAVMQALVDAGVDPTVISLSKDAHSPIRTAIRHQRLDCLLFLLEHGADPNQDLQDQRVSLSAVNYAIPVSLQIEMLKMLVAHGMDINFQFTMFGDTTNLFTVLDHATASETKDYLRSVGAKTNTELSGKSVLSKSHSMAGDLQEVIDYCERLFGSSEPRTFTPILGPGSEVSVHLIRPTTKDGFTTLFTTGLSSKPMQVPTGLTEHAYAELYMQLPGDWPLPSSDPQWSWPVKHLISLTSYPHANGTFFAVPMTTIANDDPPKPLGPGVSFTATALVADEGFVRTDGKRLELFCVIPIYESESKLAQKDIPGFLQALDRFEVSRILNPVRKPFVG